MTQTQTSPYVPEPTMLEKYRCAGCGATGCKLWREYSTFDPALYCATCAATNQATLYDISTLDADGRRIVEVATGVNMATRRVEERVQWSDQIGWYVPAVPTPVDDVAGYWGYSSIPEAGAAWWRALPSLPQRGAA